MKPIKICQYPTLFNEEDGLLQTDYWETGFYHRSPKEDTIVAYILDMVKFMSIDGVRDASIT